MNNYYSPYLYQTPSPVTVQQPTTRQNGIIWVNGEEGARSYAMVPNSNVMLLDAENEGRFYIKSADNIGMCSLRIFEYKEIIDAQPAQQFNNSSPVEYATKQELLELKNMINSLTLKYQGGGRNEQSLQPAQFRAKNVSNSNSRE